MITTAPIVTMIPTTDLERACDWYEHRLGFERVETLEGGGGVIFAAGNGTCFQIYPTGFAGTARHTLAAFVVDDVRLEVAALRAKGIVFEDYDMPELKTEDGIAWMGQDGCSWFTDPDGNILAVAQLAAVPVAMAHAARATHA